MQSVSISQDEADGIAKLLYHHLVFKVEFKTVDNSLSSSYSSLNCHTAVKDGVVFDSTRIKKELERVEDIMVLLSLKKLIKNSSYSTIDLYKETETCKEKIAVNKITLEENTFISGKFKYGRKYIY